MKKDPEKNLYFRLFIDCLIIVNEGEKNEFTVLACLKSAMCYQGIYISFCIIFLCTFFLSCGKKTT
jgi:hypothetical protein